MCCALPVLCTAEEGEEDGSKGVKGAGEETETHQFWTFHEVRDGRAPLMHERLV